MSLLTIERGVSPIIKSLLRGSAAAILFLAAAASAQEMEPRAFSPAPIGTNFALAGLSHLSGDILTDPSLPVTNVQANINISSLGYVRTFGLFERTASVGILIPYVRAGMSGNVADIGAKEVNRSGMGDLGMRFSLMLIGGPALTPEEFEQHTPSTSFGVDLKIIAPTGQYDSTHLINIGSNRWAFKPEVGLSQPIGNWFVDGITGAWFYTDNRDFFGGQVRSQEPIWSTQLDVGYQLRPGLWVSGNATYYTGGRTTVNGVENSDVQQNSRYGVTFSVPLATGWSTKFSWSNSWTTNIGRDYQELSFVLQYYWFSR